MLGSELQQLWYKSCWPVVGAKLCSVMFVGRSLLTADHWWITATVTATFPADSFLVENAERRLARAALSRYIFEYTQVWAPFSLSFDFFAALVCLFSNSLALWNMYLNRAPNSWTKITLIHALFKLSKQKIVLYVIKGKCELGERPYGCRYCWKAFADGGTLRKHERIHTGEKPYACAVCPRAFNQRVVLREHIRSHHSGPDPNYSQTVTPYSCAVCSDLFSTSQVTNRMFEIAKFY